MTTSERALRSYRPCARAAPEPSRAASGCTHPRCRSRSRDRADRAAPRRAGRRAGRGARGARFARAPDGRDRGSRPAWADSCRPGYEAAPPALAAPARTEPATHRARAAREGRPDRRMNRRAAGGRLRAAPRRSRPRYSPRSHSCRRRHARFRGRAGAPSGAGRRAPERAAAALTARAHHPHPASTREPHRFLIHAREHRLHHTGGEERGACPTAPAGLKRAPPPWARSGARGQRCATALNRARPRSGIRRRPSPIHESRSPAAPAARRTSA